MAIAIGTTPFGNTFLQIPEFVNLHKARAAYKLHSTSKRESEYFTAFNNLLDYVILYSRVNLNGITHERAAAKIFGTCQRVTKNVCRAHLLAAKCYAEEIKIAVCEKSMVANIDDLVTNLLSEFEDVLILSEKLLFHNTVDSKGYYSNSSTFSLSDVVSAANQLMFSYATKSLSSFDYRNTQPYVMVQVRQLIENASFNALGIESVTRQNGCVANGVISETLNFIIESQQALNYSIKFPFPPILLVLIYKWSCSFVHRGILSSGYVIHYAYSLTKKLLEQPLTPIQIYDGTYRLRYEYGDIEITNYNQLKLAYIAKISPAGARIINWLPLDQVGAYILSL